MDINTIIEEIIILEKSLYWIIDIIIWIIIVKILRKNTIHVYQNNSYNNNNNHYKDCSNQYHYKTKNINKSIIYNYNKNIKNTSKQLNEKIEESKNNKKVIREIETFKQEIKEMKEII